MPRQLRIEFPGACYHVMARGDRREDIYLDDIDRNSFLSILGEASKKTSWRIHAYVLMDNHYHLLIETPKANLVKGMTWLQSTYTIRFNARHKLRGHVFGGRYKAILVDRENDNYFSTLLDYIHLNPVRAGIIKQGMPLEDFSWSSISYYILPPSKRADWQHASDGLASLDCKDSAAGRRKFLKDLQTRVAWEEAEKAGTTAPPGQSLQSTLRRGWF
ncbi:MAG: transposase, partial [Verrucomicrobiota bacterium]